ncbi:MAG TPA: NADH-quinone oxidoreductase subunit NuoE [Spirochaetia bacterium]|nr:NADH-quinone oxidoreductase subunit NuoE [Spirochaetia bacterium]HBI37935.1 NADH-quinone oxidoreductase subunit NuoE [Spirochaetia bacterium]
MQKKGIDLTVLNQLIGEYKDNKGALIPLLQKAQEHYGYLPELVMSEVAKALNMSSADVYGVATFYKQFRFNPMGKYVIKVCHGTACHVAGVNILDTMFDQVLKIKAGETTEDGLFTILSVACLGCCSLAPVIMINDETYGHLNTDKLVKIIDSYRAKEGK